MAQTGAAEVTWRERSGSCAGENAEAAATRAATARVRSIVGLLYRLYVELVGSFVFYYTKVRHLYGNFSIWEKFQLTI